MDNKSPSTSSGRRPQKLVGEVQLFRIRVAAAESKVKVLREQAVQAKRRRKEAKRLAQRARKLFRQSKAELAELTQALGKAETKLLKAGGKVLARRVTLAKRRITAARRTKLPGRSSVARRRMRQTLVTTRPGSSLLQFDSNLLALEAMP